jgi:predicted ArsR family transcriptional regulator
MPQHSCDWRVAAALRNGPTGVKELATRLGLPYERVRLSLHRGMAAGVVEFDSFAPKAKGRTGSQPARYRLKA